MHKTIRILILLVVLAVIIGIWTAKLQRFDRVQPIKEAGEFAIHTSALQPFEPITSMIVADGLIFLHYDESGLVNTYDTNGVFQYGIQVCTMTNGVGDIAYADGKLMVHARGHVMYVFEGSECTEVVAYSAESPDNLRFETYEAFFAQEKPYIYHGECYYLLEDQNKVTKMDAENRMITVIDLPERISVWG